MALPSTLSIAAPEQVELRLPLAGQGSRTIAFLIDAVLRIGGALALFFIAHWTADLTARLRELHGLTLAIVILAFFFLQWVYFIAFELGAGGQTPGKRWLGLRVLDLDGQSPTFIAILLRNVLRVVDALPFGYLIGQASILLTPRRQRLGDLIAGTVVVEDRAPARELLHAELRRLDARPSHQDVGHELAADFLRRREQLTPPRRAWLARRVLETIERPDIEELDDPETRLEALLQPLASPSDRSEG